MMKLIGRNLLITVLLAVSAGMAGAWAGNQLFTRPDNRGVALHQAVHDRLDLSEAQRQQIEALEADFALQRQQLEREMRAANAELATAIREEHGYGPKVTAAVDHFHAAMGRLQKQTLRHVFAMRAVLTPAQAEAFDKTVVDALTAESK